MGIGYRAALALCTAALSLGAQAQDVAVEQAAPEQAPPAPPASAPPSEVFRLGVVEVIGEREPATRALAGDSVDAETLRALHRDDLSEALDLLPGVALQNVGQRRERLVSVRGFNSRQVPLFIDGVPVYVPYDGNVDLSRFGVDYVSEITVSKGLASVLYGPNILGGAINVVSRKPTAPLEGSARVGVESGESGDSLETHVSGTIGGLMGNWYAHATASYVDSEGYTLPDDFKPTPPAENGAGRNNAASRDTVISAKVGYLQGNGDEYALSLYRQDGKKDVPPYAGTATAPRYWRWPYWDKQSLYFTARNGIAGNGSLRWRLYYDQFKNSLDIYNDNTYSTVTSSNYDDYTFGGNTDFEWRWSDAHATRTALHWKEDVHRETDAPGSPQERSADRSYAVALEHEWRVNERLTLTPGYAYTVQDAREAENAVGTAIESFPVDRADAHNGQLTAAWTLSPQTSLLAGISRKTRFPTIKDRYSFRMGTAIPNPELGPERATHYEVAVQQRLQGLSLRAAVFLADVDDAIESVTITPVSRCATTANPNPTSCSQNQNIGEQRNTGVELSAEWQVLPTLRIDGQVSIVDRDNRSSPNIRPLDTPEQKYRLAAQWQPLQGWTFKADAQHETKRFSTTNGVRVADDFTLVNAFVRYEPLPRWGFEVGGRNLTDELYAYQEGFYEAGRTWLAQIDYRY